MNIDNMTWTTIKPSKPGYYWAYENLDECDADVIGIFVSHRGLEQKYGVGLGVKFKFEELSYFMGPLDIPRPPIDCAVKIK